jgi:hypothetical protein
MMGEAFPAQILVATDSSKEAALSKGTGAELHVSPVWRSLPHYAYCPDLDLYAAGLQVRAEAVESVAVVRRSRGCRRRS